MRKRKSKVEKPKEIAAKAYLHSSVETPFRPEAGTQAQFKKKKPPVTYRYNSSISPALDWDQAPSREKGEALIKQILDSKSLEQAKSAAENLKQLSKPFLNWTGKAERLSFDVPTLPLFVHERLSTQVIIQTLQGHQRVKGIQTGLDWFGDGQRSVADQILKAYEYKDKWVNRLILGDSLVVMNSLLQYEGMGGKAQMIYIDPPYGVKFGSNFQPFVRKRDVKDGDDDTMTREPEMVKAYRDTWELDLHSYLTYMRDRLFIARDLLTDSGSIFVQISDENLHHVKELMDEVFGIENFCRIIVFKKTTGQAADILPSVYDFILWYARDKRGIKYHPILQNRPTEMIEGTYTWVEYPDGSTARITNTEIKQPKFFSGRRFMTASLMSSGESKGGSAPFEFEGITYNAAPGTHWKTHLDGLKSLAKAKRLIGVGKTLAYKRYEDDFPVVGLNNVWNDTLQSTFAVENIYVVQTTAKVIERCLLMTTDPGDLVFDPTCGSGTTAYAAEQWGRRWITIDVSRVPLALARQRLLTATFPWFELKEENIGPAGGFKYERKRNSKGEEVGGIVPHITLKSIANNEPPEQEVLVDRPEIQSKITRITGPFNFEAMIPTPTDWEEETDVAKAEPSEDYESFVDRMIEVLRKSPVLHLGGGKTVSFKNIRPPAKTLSLSAEGVVVNGTEKTVALTFGPENDAVSEKMVYEAAKEAHAKGYAHLYIIGFAIQPNARSLIESCEAAAGIPATYVQATPDLMMGDLLKNMRSSQIFSVCGLPEIKIKKLATKSKGEPQKYQVELLGLDVFDPVEMKNDHKKGEDVPAWFLDSDYNDLCFHVSQAFFPRTSAWDNLKRALKGTFNESVWDHLAGTISAPFEAGENKQVAVKVIDDRGNELVIVKKLSEAE